MHIKKYFFKTNANYMTFSKVRIWRRHFWRASLTRPEASTKPGKGVSKMLFTQPQLLSVCWSVNPFLWQTFITYSCWETMKRNFATKVTIHLTTRRESKYHTTSNTLRLLECKPCFVANFYNIAQMRDYEVKLCNKCDNTPHHTERK